MTPSWGAIKEVVLQVAARATSGPGFLSNAIKTATLSVAASLSEMWKLGIAADLRRLKDDGLRRSKSKSDAEEAKARELLAKASEAENKATLVRRNDRISKAEEKQKLAEAAKTNAEAAAVLAKARSDEAKAQAEALATLLNAVASLNQKGGSFGINPENLANLLGLKNADELRHGLPPLLPDSGMEAPKPNDVKEQVKRPKRRKKPDDSG